MLIFILGQPMDPNGPLAPISDLTEAYRTFPAPIFKAWQDFRRSSANTLLPAGTRGCTKHRVMMLDAAARVGARAN